MRQGWILVDSLADSLNASLVDYLARSPMDSLIVSLVEFLVDSVVEYPIDSLGDSLNDSLIDYRVFFDSTANYLVGSQVDYLVSMVLFRRINVLH